jgi:hypothetical protein
MREPFPYLQGEPESGNPPYDLKTDHLPAHIRALLAYPRALKILATCEFAASEPASTSSSNSAAACLMLF